MYAGGREVVVGIGAVAEPDNELILAEGCDYRFVVFPNGLRAAAEHVDDAPAAQDYGFLVRRDRERPAFPRGRQEGNDGLEVRRVYMLSHLWKKAGRHRRPLSATGVWERGRRARIAALGRGSPSP